MGREKREERREKREREKREERERERERDIVHALQYLVPQLVRQPSSFLFLLGLLGDNINILVLILIVVVVFFSSRLLSFFEARRRLPRQHECLAPRAASPKLNLVCCSLKRRQSASFVSLTCDPLVEISRCSWNRL